MNVNSRLSYVWMKGEIDGIVLKNEGPQGNIYLYAGYKFKGDLKAGINIGYNSPWITLQGKSNYNYFSSVSLNKEFLKKKATLSASVSNPFQKFNYWKSNSTTIDFIQAERFQNYYQTQNHVTPLP